MEPNNENLSVKNTTMDDLTKNEAMPEPQEHAIEAFNQKAAEEKANAQQGIKLNKDGTPAAKRGRKPKEHGGQPRTLNDPRAPSPSNPAAPIGPDSTQAAVVISGILEQMQVVLISDEFSYEEIERAGNIMAWKNTLDHYGGVKLSPPMELAMSHASIILSRAMKPKSKTQEKLSYVKVYFKNMFTKFAKKKQLEEKDENKGDKDNAHSNTGQNTIGENNIRGKESTSIKK